MRYQVPHKEFETSFCIEIPDSVMCRYHRGIPQETKFVPVKYLEVKTSSIGGGAGLGLFAKVDIPVGATIALDQSLDPEFLRPVTVAIIENEILNADNIARQYADFYGYDSLAMVRKVLSILITMHLLTVQSGLRFLILLVCFFNLSNIQRRMTLFSSKLVYYHLRITDAKVRTIWLHPMIPKISPKTGRYIPR